MKMIKSMLTLVAASFLSCYGVAAYATGEWTPFKKVNQVYSYSTGAVFIQLKDSSSSHKNPGKCERSEWQALNKQNANFEDMLKVALTAQASGMEVTLYVKDCTHIWPSVSHIRVKGN